MRRDTPQDPSAFIRNLHGNADIAAGYRYLVYDNVSAADEWDVNGSVPAYELARSAGRREGIRAWLRLALE